MSYRPCIEILESRLAPSLAGFPDDPTPLPLSRAFPPHAIRLVVNPPELILPPTPERPLPLIALPPDLRLLGKDVPVSPPKLQLPPRELLLPPTIKGVAP